MLEVRGWGAPDAYGTNPLRGGDPQGAWRYIGLVGCDSARRPRGEQLGEIASADGPVVVDVDKRPARSVRKNDRS